MTIAVEPIDHAQIKRGGVGLIDPLEFAEGFTVDAGIVAVAHQLAAEPMHQQQEINPVGAAGGQQSILERGSIRLLILKNNDAIIAPIGAKQPQKCFGVLLGDKIDQIHRPLGQSQAGDVANIFQKDDEGNWFAKEVGALHGQWLLRQ